MLLNYRRVGSGAPLVLLHGIGSQWQVWSPVLERLAAQREVIALDLPGFGASPPPPPGTPAGAGSLAELVADFLAQIGIERPHAAGNSLGGWISLELAKQDRVRSATVLSPAGFHEGWEAAFQRASLRLGRLGARLMASRAESVVATPLGRAVAAGQYVAKPGRLPVAGAAESLRALAGADWFDETLWAITSEGFQGGSIRVPVTIAWGEKDRLLLPRQAARAIQRIPGAKLVTLRGCGHVPTYDDPDQVARVILEGSA